MILRTLLLALASLTLPAAPILWAIGGNANGLANQLIQIDVAGGTASTVTTIGNGVTNFQGGIIGSAGFLGGFINAANSDVYFAFFNSSGFAAPFLPVGNFTPGGLTGYNNTLFWIQNDAAGNSVITGNIPGSLALGKGFTGGLAFRETDLRSYAIQNDASGNSTVHQIDLNTLSVTQLAIAMGTGFTGGLAWDPNTDLFYAIRNDANANSTLYRFAAGDATPTALFSVGTKVQFAALTVDNGSAPAPAQTGVPEPSAFLLGAAGLAAIALLRHHR